MTRARPDPTTMIDPPPVRISAGAVTFAVFQTPVRLVLSTWCQSSGE